MEQIPFTEPWNRTHALVLNADKTSTKKLVECFVSALGLFQLFNTTAARLKVFSSIQKLGGDKFNIKLHVTNYFEPGRF